MAFPPNKDGGGAGAHSPVAAILLHLKNKDGGGGAGAGPGGDLEMAAQSLIDAVKAGDAKAVASIFQSMSDIAAAAPEPDADDAGEGEPMPGGEEGGPPPFPGKEQ